MVHGEIAGPIFISIGDEEKLSAFLDKNPKVPIEQALVDDYDFGAYKAAGFGRLEDTDKDEAKKALNSMTAPELGGGIKGWVDYFTTVMKVSPVPKNMKFGEIPEGVIRLGGTFVVSGEKILYQWSDRVPGDHPDIKEVFAIAEESISTDQPSFRFPSIFGL